MIKDSVFIGPKYRKITVACLGLTGSDFQPGQTIMVNERHLAPTSVSKNEFEAVVPAGPNFLDDRPVKEHEFPVGSGFQDPWCEKAYVVAGGSGLGAFVSFVKQRNDRGLKTRLLLLGRGVSVRDVTDVFPDFKSADFKCWDTSAHGRPSNDIILPQDVLDDKWNVYFAGPRTLYDTLKSLAANKVWVRLNR